MRGLILKDLLILKNQMKNLLFMLIFFIVIAFATKDFSYISFLIPFYMVTLIISTFSYDEFNHWDTYCNTLPYRKKDIVKAKYSLFLAGILLSLLFTILLSLLSLKIDSTISIKESIFTIIGSTSGISIVLALLIPFIYKYGVQKGRIVLISVVIGISLIAGILIKIFNYNPNNLFNLLNNYNTVIIVLIIITIILFIIYVSYIISSKIYENKEF